MKNIYLESEIENLIRSYDNSIILEFIDLRLFTTNATRNFQLLLTAMPIVNTAIIYNCYRKNTGLSTIRSIIVSLLGTIPIVSMFSLMTCYLRAINENFVATAEFDPNLMQSLVFVSKQLKSRLNKDELNKFKELDFKYFEIFKSYKKKYVEINSENEVDVARDYGKTTVDYIEEILKVINDNKFDKYLDEKGIDHLNYIKTNIKKQRASIESKNWKTNWETKRKTYV